MPYLGFLDRGLRTKITLDGEDATVRIVQINERGGVHETSRTSRVNDAAVFDELIGPRIVRLRVEVSPPLNGLAKLTLDQGIMRVVDAVEVNVDTEFIFDFV